LYERAAENGLNLEKIDGDDLTRREPSITGIAALFSPDTAIVDFGLVSFPLFFVFQPIGIMPPIAAHAEC